MSINGVENPVNFQNKAHVQTPDWTPTQLRHKEKKPFNYVSCLPVIKAQESRTNDQNLSRSTKSGRQNTSEVLVGYEAGWRMEQNHPNKNKIRTIRKR